MRTLLSSAMLMCVMCSPYACAQTLPWQPLQSVPVTTNQQPQQSPPVMVSTQSTNDPRINTLECSPAEVDAYFEQPDRARETLNDYSNFEHAYKQAEIIRSQDDPGSCVEALYGDLEAMGRQLKDAMSGIFNGGLPGFSDVSDAVFDQLGKSICRRVQKTVNVVEERIIKESEYARDDARREVERRYGISAMDDYMNDAIVSDDMENAGLEFRQGTIDADSFQRTSKRRWRNYIDELEDSAVDGIAGKD